MLEILARMAETGDSRGVCDMLRKIATSSDLYNTTLILGKLDSDGKTTPYILKQAVKLGCSRTIAYMLNSGDIVIQDFLACLKKYEHGQLVSELHGLGALGDLSINDISTACAEYKKYRMERFSQLRILGYTPNMAFTINEYFY